MGLCHVVAKQYMYRAHYAVQSCTWGRMRKTSKDAARHGTHRLNALPGSHPRNRWWRAAPVDHLLFKAIEGL